MKIKLSVLILALFSTALFATDYQKQFLKGNITEKTAAVRESSGSDGIWLSQRALDFVLENIEYLNDDRDMEGLAVAAVLSISPDYIQSRTNDERAELINKLIELFNDFPKSNTVQIALHSKIIGLQQVADITPFTNVLNDYLQNTPVNNSDTNVMKSVINTLGTIGDKISFSIMYNHLNDHRYNGYQNELEASIIKLIPVSMNEVLQIIHLHNLDQISRIFNLVQKNQEISKNNLSEIAENVLLESIVLVGSSSKTNEDLSTLQIQAVRILNENRWTRASATMLSFFDSAKSEYANGMMNEAQYVEVIEALVNIAPINSIDPLIKVLGELNSQMERSIPVSENVALAVVNSIGAIGDKSAFDSLLSVTYLNYPESVLSAARTALAGLRW